MTWAPMKRLLQYLRHYLSNLFSRSTIHDPDAIAVVTLTSHSVRIKRAFAAIESIGRGRCKPQRLILFLGRQYEDQPLPASLRRLQRRGLDIRFADDVGPHTKYYPYLLACDHFAGPLVTADDDQFYAADWLAGLVEAYRAYPQLINCWRARKIRIDSQGLRPYIEWPLCTSTQASTAHLATGVSGVIYPPAFLLALKSAGDCFQQCCPMADDLWLHVSALRQGFRIRQISERARKFASVPRSARSALQRKNVDCGQNDLQAARTYTRDDLALLQHDAVVPA